MSMVKLTIFLELGKLLDVVENKYRKYVITQNYSQVAMTFKNVRKWV
jgi:hypothetical protein